MAEQDNDLTVAELAAGISKKLGESSGLDATIKFVFENGEIIFIDGRSLPNSVTNDDNPADVTLKMSLETLNKLRRKELNAMMAVMTGTIKLEGNPMAAMKLDQLLS
jgi:putative sterol carrier protein